MSNMTDREGSMIIGGAGRLHVEEGDIAWLLQKNGVEVLAKVVEVNQDTASMRACTPEGTELYPETPPYKIPLEKIHYLEKSGS